MREHAAKRGGIEALIRLCRTVEQSEAQDGASSALRRMASTGLADDFLCSSSSSSSIMRML